MFAGNLLRGIACKYPSRLCDGDIPSNVEVELEEATDPLPASFVKLTHCSNMDLLLYCYSHAQVAYFKP
jgi:hypothetical protein